MAIQRATLGGGCFWCLEAAFKALKGVRTVVSGYAGGHDPHPTYQRVCGGETGHAEVVQIDFDDEQIDFATLLRVFFAIHDPTTLNRQGADVGTQYRSVIFHHGEEQAAIAAAVIARLTEEARWPSPILTEVAPAPTFHPAEDYHQDYFLNHPEQGYCQAVIAPKLAKLQGGFRDLLHG